MKRCARQLAWPPPSPNITVRHRIGLYVHEHSNPGAVKEVPNEVMERLLAADPDIIDLERRFNSLYTEIKWEYKFIKRARKEKRKEHEDLCK
jgi:hypothetical protein